MTQTPSETRSPVFGRQATAQTYRDIHLPRIFAPWAKVLLQLLPPRPGEAVLDVATGPGTVAREAAMAVGPGGRVVGVDISSAMLSVGRYWPAEPGAAPITYIEASAAAIPLPSSEFDLAYCQQGFQHMSDPLAALREMARLVNPGGRVGIAAWEQSPFGIFREAVANLGITSDGVQPSRFGVDPAELSSALADAGFENVHVERRELVSVLEGGVPQALEAALATTAGAGIGSLDAAQHERIRNAVIEALQPLVEDGAVHLRSVSNIASARRSG